MNVLDGEKQYTIECTVRSIIGVAFKEAVITCDSQNIVVTAADKTNRDCLMVYDASTGDAVNRIPLRNCGIKVSTYLIQ